MSGGILKRLKSVVRLGKPRSPYREIQLRTKTLFIHIPKTGGNSVTQMIYGLPALDVRPHVPARIYRDYSPELFAQFYVFATVRHPFTRLRSAYYFLHGGGMTSKDRRWARRHLQQYRTFAAFLQALRDEPVRSNVLRYTHFVPQVHYLCDTDDALLVKHLVRMEQFETGMEAVCHDLGRPFQARHENRTALPATGDDLAAGLEDICFDLYRQDYETLGYARLTNPS
ncbi:MAG TPA: sulfotransferase family 2 domain-containing protein [Rhizomicrobium sp.]|jgi:hypothetical protein